MPARHAVKRQRPEDFSLPGAAGEKQNDH